MAESGLSVRVLSLHTVKPLDTAAFNTLVKTASEVIRRHEQQLHAQLNKTLYVARDGAWIKVTLEIVPAEDDPYAWLAAFDVKQMGARRVLFVAHREEILNQAAATFTRIQPSARVGFYRGQQRGGYAHPAAGLLNVYVGDIGMLSDAVLQQRIVVLFYPRACKPNGTAFFLGQQYTAIPFIHAEK